MKKYLLLSILFLHLNYTYSQSFLDLCQIKWECAGCMEEYEDPMDILLQPDTIIQTGYFIEQNEKFVVLSDRYWFNEEQYYTYPDTIRKYKIIKFQCYNP
jgi:hypothetical protein